jgi:hypothetical protein
MPESVTHTYRKHSGKITFWYFVPKAGVAFIFLSIIVIYIWNQYRAFLDYSFFWIIAAEIVLFIVCFFITNRECRARK